ncbi:uncharacterized protein LOC144248734 [Lonchura striata]
MVPDGLGAIPDGSGAIPGGSVTVPDGSGAVPDGLGAIPDGSGAVPDGLGAIPVGSGAVPELQPRRAGASEGIPCGSPSRDSPLPNGLKADFARALPEPGPEGDGKSGTCAAERELSCARMEPEPPEPPEPL